MTTINTSKVLGKLEKLIDLRVGKSASERYPIVLREDNSCPSTDGTQIFLPRRENRFVSKKDNELLIANSTAHEADHIREINEYFGAEVEQLREQKINLVKEFHKRNYAGLTENPALAGWIDNIVKDRRIDTERREQLPGVKKYYEKVLNFAIEYFRPSVKGMSKLDAFREQYLQRVLIGRTIDRIPKENRILLEEVVTITNTADSIKKDSEAVITIYQKLKENFDITSPISRLPPIFGTGDHSQLPSGQPQQEYCKKINPRQGREKERRPKRLCKPRGYENDKAGDRKDKKEDEGIEINNKDRTKLYRQAQKKYGVRIHIVKPQFNSKLSGREKHFRNRYAGEIESMKRIFRQLQLKDYGNKRDIQGQDLDYGDYMQAELESRVTGIKGNGKYFIQETRNKQRPAWAVLADITPSTEKYKILNQIRAGLFINAESLGVTDWPIGLFGFSSNVLYVIKDFPERYGSTSSNKIMSLERKDNGGTYLGPPLRAVGSLLKRQQERPKGITIITDGEDQNFDDAKSAIKEVYDQKMYPFLVIIGKEFGKYAKELTEDIGSDHYTVIDRDKVHELPNEMFRLFKTFGITR